MELTMVIFDLDKLSYVLMQLSYHNVIIALKIYTFFYYAL